MSEEARWYVVHTYSGYENKVAGNLGKMVETRQMGHLIQQIRVPCENVMESTGGKEKESKRMLFPSYVLVKMIMTDESWHVVRNIRGVTSFVGPGSKPVALTDREVSMFDIDPVVYELSFDVGDSVTFTDGPFVNSVGVVEEISPDKRIVKVTISMFGRQTLVEADASSLKPLKDYS